MEIKLTFKYLILAILLHIGGNILRAQTSPFVQGHWVKLTIEESGVYKLPYDSLRTWGFHKPSQIAVFGNRTEEHKLVDTPSPHTFDDLILQEIPLRPYIENGIDSMYLLYCQGPIYKYYEYFYHHPWDKSNYIFVTDNQKGKIMAIDTSNAEYSDTLSYFQISENVIKPQDYISKTDLKSFEYGIDISKGEDFMINPYDYIDPSCTNLNLFLGFNSKDDISIRISSSWIDTLLIKEHGFVDISVAIPEGNSSTIHISRVDSGKSSCTMEQARIDAISYTVTQKNNKLFRLMNWSATHYGLFRNEDQILNINTNLPVIEVWEIYDIHNVIVKPIQTKNNKLYMNAQAPLFNYFVFVTPSMAPTPSKSKPISNFSLLDQTDVEYLIISHPDFMEEAQRLCEFRKEYNNVTANVVSTDKLYNLFSSGKKDPHAIRMYIQHLLDNGALISQLLLMGNACENALDPYNYNYNKIPSYQISEISDVFYAKYSDYYLGINDYRCDLGIGRIPCNTKKEASTYVDKVIRYEQQSWVNNTVTFIAGKEDSSFRQASLPIYDSIAEQFRNKHPLLNIEKIYLQSEDYQDLKHVNEAIKSQFGTRQRFVSYNGHSSAQGWDEKIFPTSEVKELENEFLPIILSQSCAFANTNDTAYAIADHFLFNNTGGSVAVIGGANNMIAANDSFEELNYVLLMTDSVKYIGSICTLPTRFNHKIVLGDPMLSFNYNKDTTSYIEQIEVSSDKITIPYCSSTIEELYIKISETDQSEELNLGVFDPLNVNYSGEVVLFDSVTVVNGRVEYLLIDSVSEQIQNLDILLYSFTEEGCVSFHKSGNASSYTLSPSHAKLNVYYKYPKIIIEGNDNECIESVQLFSSNGITLYQAKLNQPVPLSVSMAGLGQGIYLVKITTSNNQIAVNKLIVY